MSIQAEIKAAIVGELVQEEIRAELYIIARKVRDYAQSIAPVYDGGDPRAQPGSFKASIKAESAPDHDGMPAAKVISRSRIAHLLEFGTSKMEKRPTFAQTASHFGGTVDEVSGRQDKSEGQEL